MKKIYKVNFREYTNYSKDTVCDGDNYINAPYNKFFVCEDDIEKIRKFGGDISTMEFVGYIHENKTI